MFAYVSVVAHPFFAVTGADGTFRFPPGLPSGKYTIAALHQKAGEATQEIAVPEGRSTRVNFTLSIPQ
ncbi:MAG: carboxypeptidase-like regulatory domain-containing protein [Limisphaerales bacterium]